MGKEPIRPHPVAKGGLLVEAGLFQYQWRRFEKKGETKRKAALPGKPRFSLQKRVHRISIEIIWQCLLREGA